MIKLSQILLVGLLAGSVLAVIMLVVGGHGGGRQAVALAAPQVNVLADVAGGAPKIHYQGRLLDPTTGQAKPDGSYQMVFSLYNVDAAGAPLWTETKNVAVSKGLFSTLLGDTTALDLGDFDGQDLFLGLSVQGDPEATPRQPIAHVAYAIYARQAANAESATNAANATNADTLDSQDSSAFAAAAHTHGGAEIVDGSLDTNDLADGSVTAAKLAPGVAPKFFSLDPFAAFLDLSAFFDTGFGPHAGIHMPDGSNSSFYLGFTIPPDYATGTALIARLLWHTSAASCGIAFLPNAISVARPGRTHITGATTGDGLTVVGGTTLNAPGTGNQTNETIVHITSPDGVTDLLAGDSVIFSLFRAGGNGNDTCAADMVLQSVSITYQ
jgi:hypothetical protein